MRLPIRLLGLTAAGLLVGTALGPVAAQQMSGTDGQVAVRSDGAVYLISGGQRRWIATVQVSDDDLNAYPEGDPILAGLAMAGSAAAAGPAPASKPNTSASPAPSSSSGSSGSSSGAQATATKAAPGATATATPDTAVSTEIPIDVTIDETSNNTFQAGDKFAVEIKTTKDFICELSIKWPNDQEDNEDSKEADSRGRCKFNVEVPDGMSDGTAKVKGWSRSAGKYNRMDVDITIKNKS